MNDSIVRLHPFDGLFLRARHLDRLQDYVRALSADGAVAGGSGTVFGLDVRVDGAQVVVTAGFAVSGQGRLLVADQDVRTDLPAGDGPLWRVDAVSQEVAGEADELTYSRLPGSDNGGRRSSTTIERLAVQVSTADAPAGTPDAKLRSAVAAAWFAAERAAQGLPAPMTRWDPLPPPDQEHRVPLGLLLKVGGSWTADVWTVRRDRVEPLPEQRRQWSLGLRPRSAADAQLRQFEAQLAGWVPFASALPDQGLVELPPGGFLPVPAGPVHPASVRAAFGGSTVRVFACDEATARARVEGAQHRDRIPLPGTVVVDVFVPGTWAADGTVTPSAGWAAFARAEVVEPQPVPPPAPYEIDLFAVRTKPADYPSAIADAQVHAGPPDQFVGTLSGTTVPGLDAYRTVAGTLDGATRMTMLVVAPAEDDLPLAGQRAAEVLSCFGGVAADRPAGVVIAGLPRPAVRIITEKP